MTTDRLWPNHSERYRALPAMVDRAFAELDFELSATEKQTMFQFVEHLSDIVAEAIIKEQSVEEWATEALKSLLAGTQTFARYLVGMELDRIILGEESASFGILGQALDSAIEQMRPIAQYREPIWYDHFDKWEPEVDQVAV